MTQPPASRGLRDTGPPATCRGGQGFPRAARVVRQVDFQRIYHFRNSVADAHIVLYVAPNEVGHARLGLSVSRKIGNSVRRNRWKRLVRESFRSRRHQLPACDLVLIPRQPEDPGAAAIGRALEKLAWAGCRKIQAKAARAAQRKSHSDPKEPPRPA